MNGYRILIADDESTQRKTLAGFLKKRGYDVLEAEDGAKALATVERETVDLVLSDLRMPGLDGLELLARIKATNPLIEVIVMTAFGTIENAVEAMQNGAFTYVQKPVNLKELENLLEKALERKLLLEENRELKARLEGGNELGIIGTSSELREVLGMVSRAAPSRASVLILGESGTGKELFAKAVHNASPRAGKSFVPVNVAAIPETLLESELFGHEKGSFTGAASRQIGKFERADGGTLFIDEVGDMPLSAQVKLLRVLQEGTIERVGGDGPINVDVRIVAATNRDLERAIADGEFREDLFYRLNVVRLELPALRTRKIDVAPLAEHFIAKYASMNGKKVTGFDHSAMDAMMKYSWPGNVRELENVVESAVVMCRGELVVERDLPPQLRGDGATSGGKIIDDENHSLPERVDAFERMIVIKALDETGGNNSETARRLGVSEKAIRTRLKRWGVENS